VKSSTAQPVRSWLSQLRTLIFALVCLFAGAGARAREAIPPLEHYEPREIEIPKSAGFITPSGAFAVVGYNDMREMLEAMVRLFVASHPNFRFELDLRGTRFAPAALARGTSAFAPMGGEFTPQQLDDYRAVAGGDPILFRVAHASLNPRALSGPLAIFVHRDNPLRSLTLAQAARAFTGEAARWGSLGGTGVWADRPIHSYGLKPETVLGLFAQVRILGGKSFGKDLAGFPQSTDVVAEVSKDPMGIGFAAANRGSESVRALALAATAKDEPVASTVQSIVAGRYPLDRFLLIYAKRPLTPVAREFLRLVLSREGQEMVAAAPQGYLPLSAAEVAAERARLE
jgi:phosphate transport system substrate-binding protein